MPSKQSRRSSGNMSIPSVPFNRQLPPHFPDSSPAGPSTSFGYYDRYGPPEEPIAPSFRESFSNEYNPNFWKPDPDFYPNTVQNGPFPDRVPPPQGESWQRPPGWRDSEPSVWSGTEARDSTLPVTRPAPVNNRRGNGGSRPPNRIFEPSDNWKQTHERYRPYSNSGSSSNARNRHGGFQNGPRRSFHGHPSRPSHDAQPPPFPPLPYDDKWDESVHIDTGPHRPTTLSTSPDRIGRMGEKSIPTSPRGMRHRSPKVVVDSFAPKRESPELPHLEALPSRQSIVEPYHIPLPMSILPPKPQSRSSSHSSGSSPAIPQSQPQSSQAQPMYGLPPKPPPQARSRQQISMPIPNSISAHPPAPQSVPIRRKQTPPALTQNPKVVPQTKDISDSSALSSLNNAPRPFPSFVPSTLAIDAPLMFPIEESKMKAKLGKLLDYSIEARPMDVSHEILTVKIARGAVETESISSSQPPTRTTSPAIPSKATSIEHNLADESDMDMSPPASPAIQISSLPVEPFSDAASNDRELSRPSLIIDTTTSSPRVRHTAPRRSSSASPVPTTPENADEIAGDVSDMDMSSAASDIASSPPAEPQRTAAPTLMHTKVSLPQPPAVEEDVMIPGLSLADSAACSADKAVSPVLTVQMLPEPPVQRAATRTPSPVSPTPAPVASSVLDSSPAPILLPVPTSLSLPLSVSLPSSPSPPTSPPAPTPPPALTSPPEPALLQISLSPPTLTSLASPPAPHSPSLPTYLPVLEPNVDSEASVQPSLVTSIAVPLENPHVEVGELSPLASEEETLREDTEAVEKELGLPAVAVEVPLDVQENTAVVTSQTADEQMLQELPLSEALRLVAKLRFRHDPMTQDARVEPILYSNRQLAELQSPASPQPEVQGQSAVEQQADKVQQQLNDGMFGGTKHSLRKRFAQHQAALTEKVTRLRKEYMALHERWLVHCAKLDEVARASALEEAAATAGRTTRRTASMGDAVRSDLEMEQILASLGNEELTDANHLSQKNAAVIPDMVSVTKGRVEYIYDDTNNLVEDPHEFYKLETGIDDWSEEEKQILIDKYAIHPKQFGIIADYLPNKTPAQCVTYYYLHKNTTIDFRKIIAQYNTIGKRTRRGRNAKQKGNALLADILKHDDEVSGNRDGTPTVSGRRKRNAAGSTTPVPASTSTELTDSASTRKAPVSRKGTAQNTPDPTPDPEPNGQKRPRRRANLSAKAAAALETETPDEPVDEERPVKRTRKGRKSKVELDTETATVGEDNQTSVAESKPPEPAQPEAPPKRKSGSGSGNWTEDDRALFLKLLAQHGDDFKRIASSMANKTTIQVAAFYRSHSTEMNLSKVVALAPKRSPTPHDIFRNSKLPIQVIDGHTIARSRSSGRMSPPPNPDSSRPLTASAPLNGIPVPMYRPTPPYHGGIGSAFASTSRSNPSPLTNGLGGRPPTLTMSFPTTLAYSNLSPSSFAGPPISFANSAPSTPGTPGVGGSNGVTEFSEFAPQPQSWNVPALMRPGDLPVAPGTIPGTGLPATLETTEDLVRYLEHRTRMSAEKSTEGDFM